MKRYIAPALAFTMALTACEGAPQSNEATPSAAAPAEASANPIVEVRNILGVPIQISTESHYFDQSTDAGDFRKGETAVAHCVNYDPQFPDNTNVYIEADGGEGNLFGYVGAKTASSKEEVGVPQLDKTAEQLHRALPTCDDYRGANHPGQTR